jgi:ketosteroid isomerase-like protein
LERLKLERKGEMNGDPLNVSDQTEQLEKFAGNWATAELRGDAAFLERNLADDFVGVGPYGFLLTKDEWLQRHESRKLRYETFRLDEVRARFYGEAAVMIARQMTKGKYEDNDLPGSLRATLFFAQQEGRWLLAGIHMSFVAGGS